MKQRMPVSTRLWALAVVVAGLFAGWALLWPAPNYLPEVASDAVLPTYPAPLAMNPMPPNSADQAWAKPLFFNDRNPRVASVDNEGLDTGAHSAGFRATLTGILRSPGAILVTLGGTESGKPLLVRLGDEVEGQPGWRLVDVGVRQATFRNADQEHVLKIVAREARNNPPPSSGSDTAAALSPPSESSPPTPGVTGQATAAQQTAATTVATAAGNSAAETAGQQLEPEQRQQVEAIRRRIEERRKQLRQSNPSPKPTP